MKKVFNMRSRELIYITKSVRVICQVLRVREAVKNVSNEQIVLVLQYYDNDVDKTVNAFLQGYTSLQ